MQDFSSISVSSYEAGILADRLTEQSREGWEVVAIVPTGSTVTAYLSRSTGAADDGSADEATEQAADEATEQAAEPHDGSADEATEQAADEATEQAAEPHDGSADEATEHAADEVAEQAAEPEPADAQPQADAETMIDEIVPESATADDIGWAALASEIAEGADDEIVPSLPEGAPVAIAIEPEPASPEPAPTAEAITEVDAAAAAGAAPAGWYADPSARFELRYWDGTQWTEHVSRAGQQYTDPPVA